MPLDTANRAVQGPVPVFRDGAVTGVYVQWRVRMIMQTATTARATSPSVSVLGIYFFPLWCPWVR